MPTLICLIMSRADPLGIRQPPPAPLVDFRSGQPDLNFVGPPQSPRQPHSGRRAPSRQGTQHMQRQHMQQQQQQQRQSSPLPVSHDVSFLADDAAYRRHGGQPAMPQNP